MLRLALCLALTSCFATSSTLTVQRDGSVYQLTTGDPCNKAVRAHPDVRVISCETHTALSSGGAIVLVVIGVVLIFPAIVVYSVATQRT